MCVCVCVCVCVLGGGQIKVKSNFVFLSIYPLFIILPHFPFSPLRQIPSPHYWTTFLSPSYPLCKQSLSSAPCRLRVGIVSPQPPRHSDATVTFTFRHFAWGLLLWSLATAVCSHPLNFIYPNLSDSWGGGAQKGKTHKRARSVFPLCYPLWCVSLLENSLFSTVYTLQSIDSQLHFALSSLSLF